MSTPARPLEAFRYLPVDAETHRWDLYLTSMGHSVYGPGEPYPRGDHPADYWFTWKGGRRLPDYTLVWIRAGRGVLDSQGGGRRELVAGSRFMLPPGAWHRYRPDPGTGWEEAWLCLNGAYCHRLGAGAVLPDRVLAIGGAVEAAWAARFDALLEQVRGAGGNEPRFGFEACGLLAGALSGSRGLARLAAQGASAEVDRILGFLDEHAHRPLKVREVAARFGMSLRTLERRFAEAGRGTVRRELMEARVRRAEALMRDPAVPLKQIAYAAGFRGTRRLYETCVALRGCSPSAHRAQLLAPRGKYAGQGAPVV